jgi:putative transposase
MSTPDRKAMLERGHPEISIRRQCVLLSLARSGVYRAKRPANDDADLVLMRRIDALFMAWPFLGSRRMTAMLRAEGHRVNRKRVQRLMRLMGIAALGPKPRTTKPQHGHKIFPYLLRDPAEPGVGRRHYVHPDRSRLSLPGRHHRLVLACGAGVAAVEHDEAAFCVDALEEALARWGKPEIFNTDQGSQFTSAAFTGRLAADGIRISMDGAAGSTTCSSNGCGGPSSTRMST